MKERRRRRRRRRLMGRGDEGGVNKARNRRIRELKDERQEV